MKIYVIFITNWPSIIYRQSPQPVGAVPCWGMCSPFGKESSEFSWLWIPTHFREYLSWYIEWSGNIIIWRRRRRRVVKLSFSHSPLANSWLPRAPPERMEGKREEIQWLAAIRASLQPVIPAGMFDTICTIYRGYLRWPLNNRCNTIVHSLFIGQWLSL